MDAPDGNARLVRGLDEPVPVGGDLTVAPQVLHRLSLAGLLHVPDSTGTKQCMTGVHAHCLCNDKDMTPYDTLPIEARRANWGWFGQPWPSGICYDEDGRLLEEMRKPFPADESCLNCGELLDEAAGDNGQAMPFLHADATVRIAHVHKECMLREVTGSVDCLKGHHRHETGQSRRQEALATWAWVQEHGIQ